MLRRIKRLFSNKKIENVLITPYRSYGTRNHLYLLGRALDDIPLEIVQDHSFFNTLKTTYKQFDSFEIPHAKIELNIPDFLDLKTEADSEGYFLFEQTFEKDLSTIANEEGWVTVNLLFRKSEDSTPSEERKHFQGEVLIPDIKAEYGIISDIDDTIIHTGVTSFLKWRLVKNSLLTNAYKRIPFKGAAEFYKKLHLGRNADNKNPVFYISNSPWNLYQYLKLFMDYNKFPKGPMLLRNFRTPFDRSIKPEKPHKQKEIINILNTYPELKFILIGDSGEHDASIYTDIAAQYPNRILAIYLRSVNHKRQMNRVKSIVTEFETTPILMVDNSIDAEEHAREMGFIK
ncbi:phosphatidate phosphatase APP1 [Gillisia mitskevichiae]|uniref:Phosphatidate phosphatase APP1 n=1 Tax=Gillisia mitskevichiae TaxID=270921 RepID=A0A495PZY9_9FLAO|nr:phosphatase domain-containing protein [Gillisia mitskevichiae]RKS56101.1 phosphatidate phosphatase APP1 [Gillisia mitskevichiae]